MERDDRFRIFVDQLRHGNVEALKETFAPDFLEVVEEELQFQDSVEIEGETYLAENELIIHFMHIRTCAEMPCRICNEPVRVEINISGNYQVIPVKDIKGGVLDYRELLREVILLDTPAFAECHPKGCPQRKELKRYIKPENTNTSKAEAEGDYHPFADL